MNTNTELIRSHVDTIIMRTLENQDRYGYEILDIIASLSDKKYVIKQPTLYSCLKRLEKQGFISSYAGIETNGAQRKYYKLEDKGKDTLIQDKNEWEFSRSIIDKLLSDKKIDLKEVTAPFDASNLRPLTKRIKAFDILENQINSGNNVDSDLAYLDEQYDENNEVVTSVSIELFDMCKNKLKESEEKVKQLQKLLDNNSEKTIPLDFINFEYENIQLKKAITNLENDLASKSLNSQDNLNNNNDDFNYLSEQLENIQTEYGLLNKKLIEKINENNLLKADIEQLNSEKYLFSAKKLFEKEAIPNKEIEYKTLKNENPLNLIFKKDNDSEIIEQNTDNDQSEIILNAKKLLSIGEYSNTYMPDIDENFKISYKENLVVSSSLSEKIPVDSTQSKTILEQPVNNLLNKTTHISFDNKIIKEKTIDAVHKNTVSEQISTNSLISLKNDMIKNGYKIKTYTKDTTQEYYRNNYVYYNKMLIFISLSLFFLNFIELLVFGLAKETFLISNNILLIIFGVTLIATIITLFTSIRGVKIVKKSENYIKVLLYKTTLYFIFFGLILLIFSFNTKLNNYFLKAPMFVPLILLLNIPLSEVLKMIAEKSNKYNVSY